jgi:hypothetical protein
MFSLRAVLGVVAYLIGSECALPELTCRDVLKPCLPRFPFTGVEGVAFYSPTKNWLTERFLENLGQFDKR